MNAPLTLEVRNLSVTIPLVAGPLHAVRGIDLEVRQGETLCIVGESGCGKSMTSLALMNLLPPRAQRRAATIRFKGEDLVQADDARMEALRGDRIAMIFQEPMTALNPAYTIGDQLTEGLLRHRPGTTRAATEKRAVELLETCGVGQAGRRLGQYPHQLSGGLRQRVMIAMALMTEPDLLIADEPTTALDATIQTQILDLLIRLQREFALAVILITHNFEVVRRVADRVAVMYAGKIVETGAAADVLAQPSHPYTRALLSCLPGEQPRNAGSRLGFLPGTVPSLIGSLQGCQFRNRCAVAHEACERDVPLHSVSAGRDYLCHIPPAQLRTRVAVASSVSTVAAKAVDADNPAIAMRGVRVTYPVSTGLFAPKAHLQALRGIDVLVGAGQVLGVVGESGSGKSTFARILLGLEKAEAGTVQLMGRPADAYGRAARARVLQPIFQDPYSSLNPRRTIAGTIRLPLDIHGIGTMAERRAEVRRMMELCGLPERLAEALPAQLSGGQRQRVAIASALILKPAIVVCDEPTSALDVSVQAQILNLLQDLRDELGLTYVVISHDLGVIRCLADRVAVMYLGAIVEDRPAGELFVSPVHPYTRMLMDAPPAAGDGTLPGGEFPNPLSPPGGCAFHPRCPRALDVCRTNTPLPRPLAGGLAACHNPVLISKGSA